MRPRSDSDLAACERIAREVRRSDGYPVYLRGDDFRGFLAAPDALGAWVAVDGADVVGQVALHARSSAGVVALVRDALGTGPTGLGFVARLVVAPGARRRGIGARLLEVATDDARRRGLVPVLDVVAESDGAVALYERAGWRRLGTADVALPDGTRMLEHVYAAP